MISFTLSFKGKMGLYMKTKWTLQVDIITLHSCIFFTQTQMLM